MKPTDADYEAAYEALQPWRDNCSLDEDHLVACAIAKSREDERETIARLVAELNGPMALVLLIRSGSRPHGNAPASSKDAL